MGGMFIIMRNLSCTCGGREGDLHDYLNFYTQLRQNSHKKKNGCKFATTRLEHDHVLALQDKNAVLFDGPLHVSARTRIHCGLDKSSIETALPAISESASCCTCLTLELFGMTAAGTHILFTCQGS